MTLKNKITTLAEDFSAGILAAIKAASLEELLAESGASSAASRGLGARRGPGRPAKGAAASLAETSAPRIKPAKTKGGRLVRRSAADIDQVVSLVIGALKKSKAGLRSEQLQKELGISKKEIVRPIEQALANKKISKKGQKRATTYFAR